MTNNTHHLGNGGQMSAPVETLTEAARATLVSAIISGQLAPGSRLGVKDLAMRFGFGPTPLREALSSIAARGLVTFSGQRGFRVAPTSRQDLRDIVQARNVVETGALRLSIENGDAEWEAGIVAALHRLKTFNEQAPTGSDVDGFERVNKAFHLSLISACASQRLLAIYDDLFEQTRRYRSLMLSVRRVDDRLVETHRALADLCLARKADQACRALIEHNHVIIQLVYGLA